MGETEELSNHKEEVKCFMLEPVYGEIIIVGVIESKEWYWYVTEKDFWILDYNKLESAYKLRGYDISNSENNRFGIKVLQDEEIHKFLNKISKYKVSRDFLYNLMIKKINSNDFVDLLDFQPALLVDFDDHILYSMYTEPYSFEEYVPADWSGIYEDFTSLVPEEERYWINEIKENLFFKKGI